MGKRQVRQMFRLMASGEPVQLTSPMASVKKLARLAFMAQQFGYEYADVRQGSGRNNALTMLIVPDPAPQAQARAAQNWAQYPKAGDGVSLPPVVPDARELLKARINFDLTGKNAEKRMRYGFVGLTVACVVLGVRTGGDSVAWTVAGVLWAVLMVVLGIGIVVTRKRNAKFAARLQAAGFAPVTEEGGRVRYLPPTAGYGGYAGYGGHGGHGGPPGAGYGAQTPGPYGPYGLHGAYSPQTPQTPQAPLTAPAQPTASAQFTPPSPYAQPGPQTPQGPYAPPPTQGQSPYGAQAPAAPAAPGPCNPSGAAPAPHPSPNPYTSHTQPQPRPQSQPPAQS
ncbi:hypothetical protein [Streptomyces sp. NBC_00198]|uniref:hypothetical protein n=1 Tax=Streptomyces sp. NBC_00198 TaxID=2975677 RepID=UPI00225282C0|nr:hypothetical protein [Streptomyces sp. NBC_00198]MCX5283650.1 hypothetical protein [Streptomyces sp. NBC_00198]